MIVVGLTGSIGMGKSTTARLFAEEGAPVWDADATVHRLYAAGGAAVAAVEAAFAGVTDPHGAIDRVKLGARVHGNAEAFSRLEGIVHPLVAADRGEFLDRARASRAAVAILDIPLLFETGAAERMDAVVVVSAPAHVQRQRVLARPGMDEARLAALLERQTPDHHKRAGADFVIDTSEGVEPARVQVRQVLAALADPGFRSRRGGLDEAPEAQH